MDQNEKAVEALFAPLDQDTVKQIRTHLRAEAGIEIESSSQFFFDLSSAAFYLRDAANPDSRDNSQNILHEINEIKAAIESLDRAAATSALNLEIQKTKEILARLDKLPAVAGLNFLFESDQDGLQTLRTLINSIQHHQKHLLSSVEECLKTTYAVGLSRYFSKKSKTTVDEELGTVKNLALKSLNAAVVNAELECTPGRPLDWRKYSFTLKVGEAIKTHLDVDLSATKTGIFGSVLHIIATSIVGEQATISRELITRAKNSLQNTNSLQ